MKKSLSSDFRVFNCKPLGFMEILFKAEVIAFILLILSGAGIGILLKKKIPLLLQFPREENKNLAYYVGQATERAKEYPAVSQILTPELLLQRVLSKIRVWSLKVESRASSELETLRKRALEKKEKLSENYWAQIRKRRKKIEG